MKKIILVLAVILMSCENNIEEPIKLDCVTVIYIDNGELRIPCEGRFTVGVVNELDYVKGVSIQSQTTYICVTNEDFEFNDFYLGQKICDYDVLTK